MVQANSHYRTSDTALAAFLITKHYNLISVDYNLVRFEFIFSMSGTIQKDATDYLIGNALTDPSYYSRIFRKLNRMLRKQCQWEED